MTDGIAYETAWQNYSQQPRETPGAEADVESLLLKFHPDWDPNATTKLQVGPNSGDKCQREIAQLLESNALIDEVDLAGAPVSQTDVLIIGSGGAGCAAALSAGDAGARVVLATKLRLGDSNTVMAEGGIQAAIDPEDSPQLHYEDTLKAGHHVADKELVAQMAMDGPPVIRWLIQRGMRFDQTGNSPFDNLTLKRPGGASAPRILSYGDYTGLEMMRVLREAVRNHPSVHVRHSAPVVELLSDEQGNCAGGVIYDVSRRELSVVKAASVILATGGLGRLHLNGYPTSNHFGATGDGLVLAYRLGAKLRDLDSFQYHPTGLAWPNHLVGALVSEAARSAGAHLINGLGERFTDELQSRDVVSAAIIRECREGRGILRDGKLGVFLDTPGLEKASPGTLAKFGSLLHLAKKCGADPAEFPFLVYPTLHYQNGGIVIDSEGATTVPNLYSAGENSGGIHGRNRLMGNALLEIISFGRRAGARAAQARGHGISQNISTRHLLQRQRELTHNGLPLDNRAPQLFPDYSNFTFRDHLEARI